MKKLGDKLIVLFVVDFKQALETLDWEGAILGR